MQHFSPTTDPALNGVLSALVTRSRAILGSGFVGAYLHGSFALGAGDIYSDVDFMIVVERPLTDAQWAALDAMHSAIYQLEPHWARHLEGSYFPTQVLRRRGAEKVPLPFLNNTSQSLALDDHDDTRVVRWMVREYGIILDGPDPKTLIDPISPDELRAEVRETMRTWSARILAHPEAQNNRWFQAYAVLSFCRMLHTLHTGRVGSKPAGAEWAIRTLDAEWVDLIRRAWEERPNPSLKVRMPADKADLDRTMAFIRYALSIAAQAR